MCLMCCHNPMNEVDGTHKVFTDTSVNQDLLTIDDVSYSTIPADTSTGATISVGQTVEETLETAGDRDWFKITLQAGDRITIDLEGVDHAGSALGALSDPYLRLYSSNGSFVTGNDDGGPGLNSSLTFTVQSSGTYFIEAAAYSDNYAGDYQLEVQSAAPLAEGNLQQLSDYLVGGYWSTPRYWNLGNSGTNAKAGVLTYTLDGYASDTNGLSAARAQAVREAFKMYEAVLGIDFQETSSTTADFRFRDNDSGAYAGSSYSVSGGTGFISYSYINIATSWSGGSSAYDSYTFQTILHEIGHALGLGHQGGYNGSANYPNDANFSNDSWQASMMSYFSQNENNTTGASYATLISPMAADWLALNTHYAQYGFGTSNAFTGDTVWGFNTNISASTSQVFHDLALYANDRAFTIIDSGGNDTVDFSGYGQNQRIDLTVTQAGDTQATTSDIGTDRQNMTLAVGTVIENARSGSGDDQLKGNQVANSLYGGGGNDTLEGVGGNDFLFGGSGASDVAVFSGAYAEYSVTQTGSNTYTVSHISGTQADGTDTLEDVETARFSDQDIALNNLPPPPPTTSVINGTEGADNLTGDGDPNEINGLGGNDTINALDGNDTLFGGAGNDTLDGGLGNDTINGGENDDFIVYDAADDPGNISGGSGTDTLVIYGGTAPFSYDLLSGSFEYARHEEQDTTGQTWDTRTTLYGPTWEPLTTTTRNDDGSRIEDEFDFFMFTDVYQTRLIYNAANQLTYRSQNMHDGSSIIYEYDPDNGQSWSTIEKQYDTQNRLSIERVYYDDGSRIEYSYDPANAQSWTSIQTTYNTAGALSFRRFNQDDGSRNDYFFDVTDEQPWTSNEQSYNAAGNLTVQRFNYDDGTRATYNYDLADAQWWSSNEQIYDAADNLMFQRFVDDDGTRNDYNYDVADAQSWSTNEQTYNAAGQLTSQRFVRDDGSRTDTNYDAADTQSWSINEQNYNAAGQLTSQRFNQDDGSRDSYNYDVADVQSWSTNEQSYNAADALVFQRFYGDDGTRSDYNYDHADEQGWSANEQVYNAAGNLTFQRFVYDDGTRNDDRYDLANEHGWASNQQTYNASGQITFQRFVYDDGTRLHTNYDADNVESWDYRNTTYDADGNILTDVFV